MTAPQFSLRASAPLREPSFLLFAQRRGGAKKKGS